MIPTVEEIEGYLESIEELFLSSTSSVPDFPNVRDAVHRLWADISRFGPPGWSSFPDIHLPSLGDFEIPPRPPPPPPPPPKSAIEKSFDWISDHPKTTAGIAVGLAGAGLWVGYGSFVARTYHKRGKRVQTRADERRQVVVVLGGDTPLGLPLILELEKQGFIVITSVSTQEGVDDIEHKCHGFVRALVLDPLEPDTLTFFLRSLMSTLSRRFPITLAGDPYASPLTGPYIHSVVCLLTLPSPNSQPVPAPLEHISLRDSYLSYLTATHITPLQVIQALLPMLRSNPARSRDSLANHKERKSIIVCLPAMDARVGLPFASEQAMSAAATLRGVEVLRREIRIAALSDPTESMKNIKVVAVDIGAVASPRRRGSVPMRDIIDSMDDWTPSEKHTYGSAFLSAVEEGHYRGVRRKPTDVAQFVDSIVTVITGGRNSGTTFLGFEIGLDKIRNWIRGERFAVGAGARTYALASYLPTLILDGLLNLPHFLLSIRNALVPVPPRVPLPNSAAAESTMPPPVPPQTEVKAASDYSAPSSEGEHRDRRDNDSASEADVESNADTGGVSESWVNLQDKTSESHASIDAP
ncbi:hypothetical protein GLOTRDRAFT_136789 [Gloeophyllum trabeum ATCC 11539]|uniref:DUF1776-domain-containing protein n=1 Tax=Gloeophyllum trabeum (strain ATCC 11539 / FP-39264 / Madison 617) TaxID=670483 RepID=S7QEZ2_GLOTA|nr:uncharacterized protein GLOTRDRAFT_136789 [Gloeophyllum trabeum ATCC 11539]EPQ57977.1 hypothetical protein GLOTRDRAFT_136789 [Gloeophyllum trabeum ATCC 11539]